MHRLPFIAVAFLYCTLAVAAPKQPNPLIVGYVFPEDRLLRSDEIDTSRLDRINYAFANIQDGIIVPGFPTDSQNLALLTAQRKRNPNLTVLISVGGWLWSGNFSDVSLTSDSRSRFIDSAIDFIARNSLDGLDIDWEYPGLPGAGHKFRSEDKHNFTQLLAELRSRFDTETRKTHRRLYLTIAAGASAEYIEHTEMAQAQSYLDTVNLMSYDYYETADDHTTGHHAPLFSNDADPKHVSADESVQAFEKAGVPAAKLLLGLPFYGHIWGHVPDHNHGLFQPGKAYLEGEMSYGEIQTNMLQGNSNDFVRTWDPVSSVPSLYSASKQIFVSYEDPTSVAAKCAYVQSHHLGGVMFWDYESDPSGTLLQAADKSLGKQH